MANKQSRGTQEVETLNTSEAFILKYKKAIIIAVAAVFVIIAGVFVYNSQIAGPRKDKASTAIARGQEYFNNQQFDKALNGDGAGYVGFAKIASDFSGTDAANLANLYAGLSNANLGKWDEAVKFLNAYSPAGDQMVSPAAQKADSKAKNGTNNSLSPTFLLKAGEILESQGKKDEALKIYQDIKQKYVASMLVQSQEIDKYIERASVN